MIRRRVFGQLKQRGPRQLTPEEVARWNVALRDDSPTPYAGSVEAMREILRERFGGDMVALELD
jgi:hypothetical protein